MLNRVRVTKLLAGFPTFTTSGARPFMGHHSYRTFIRAVVELRDDLKLVSTPDGGVAVAACSPPPAPAAAPSRSRRGEADDDATSTFLGPGPAPAKG